MGLLWLIPILLVIWIVGMVVISPVSRDKWDDFISKLSGIKRKGVNKWGNLSLVRLEE